MSNDKRRTRQRAEWREAGRCLDCGDPELAYNKDGTRSRYCAQHLSIHSTAHRNNTRAPVYLIRECIDFRDSREYEAYTSVIKGWFEEHGTLTIPQINRMLGDLRNDAWTMCVLESLHLIESGVQPVRYTIYVPRAMSYDYASQKIAQAAA